MAPPEPELRIVPRTQHIPQTAMPYLNSSAIPDYCSSLADLLGEEYAQCFERETASNFYLTYPNLPDKALVITFSYI